MQKKEDALKGVKLFVLDMDGTVYLGNHMIDGALDFIHEVDASEDIIFSLQIMLPVFHLFMWRSFINWAWM